MNYVYLLLLYLAVCTIAAVLTQFTGKGERPLREGMLVWWFFPLGFFYCMAAGITEGTEGVSNSLGEFIAELMNLPDKQESVGERRPW